MCNAIKELFANEVKELKKIVADKDATIADKDAAIVRLQAEIDILKARNNTLDNFSEEQN